MRSTVQENVELNEEIETSETRSTERTQTSADPEDPDFGLWTPGSEA